MPPDLSLEIDRPIDLALAESVIVASRKNQDGNNKLKQQQDKVLDNGASLAAYESPDNAENA